MTPPEPTWQSECGADLRAPFPWFGGKIGASELVWERLGPVTNFVEPFAGSLAVLLARPHEPGIETVNDLDGFISNFWRAIKADPQAVAHHADHPVFENDLHARHAWLVGRKDSMQARLEGDPDWFDAKIAGFWVWGTCCWIGSGFCSGNGPWQVAEVDGIRKLVHLGNKGRGVNRQLVHLGNKGQGVNRQREDDTDESLLDYFDALASRLRKVRVCCGDWSRVCGPTPTFKHGLTGVFLDPPYADTADRTADLYRQDSEQVAHQVRAWAIANSDNPLMRIALCGYEAEHEMPADWLCVPWKAKGGYGSQAVNGNENCKRERIWFSKNCLNPELNLL